MIALGSVKFLLALPVRDNRLFPARLIPATPSFQAALPHWKANDTKQKKCMPRPKRKDVWMLLLDVRDFRLGETVMKLNTGVSRIAWYQR